MADSADILAAAVRLGESDVRLVPDGCDYLLVGSARGSTSVADGWLAVPASPPGGGQVFALVETGARGVTMEDPWITFSRTPVAAARLVAITA